MAKSKIKEKDQHKTSVSQVVLSTYPYKSVIRKYTSQIAQGKRPIMRDDPEEKSIIRSNKINPSSISKSKVSGSQRLKSVRNNTPGRKRNLNTGAISNVKDYLK